MSDYNQVGRADELEPEVDFDEPTAGDHLSEVGEDEPGEEPTTGSDPERITLASATADWFEVYKSEINKRPAHAVFTGQNHHDPFDSKNTRGRFW
jgi:hypothetical protein